MATTTYEAAGLIPTDTGESSPSVSTSYEASGMIPNDKVVAGGPPLGSLNLTGVGR